MDATMALLVSIAVCGVIWHVVTTILIYNDLRQRNQPVSFILLRLMSPWYASRYREITRTETGKTGPLFYQWLISINTALVCVLLAVIFRYFD